MKIQQKKDGYGGCLMYAPIIIIIIIILLFSCNTAKNIQQVKVNTDSIVTHIADSVSHNLKTSYDNKLKEILDNQSSLVQFIRDTIPVPTGCDSADLVKWKQISDELKSKITIDKNGITTYEGRIASYQQQLNHSSKESDSLKEQIDQWRYVHEEDSTKLSVKATATVKTVERSFIPWWIFLAAIAAMASAYYLGYRIKK